RRHLQTHHQQPVPLRHLHQRHGSFRPRRPPQAHGALDRVHRHGQCVPRDPLLPRRLCHPHRPGGLAAQHRVCRRGGHARGACVCLGERKGDGYDGAAGHCGRGGGGGCEAGFSGEECGV
ncbi:hypothetical protein E4U54_008397, partial [Claviceps lovelessii]